jgi:NAD(P)H dehydrogenase (quinone)
LDQPGWFYRLRYAAPTHHAMKGLTLKFIGVKNVNITTIGPIRLSKEKFRTKYLKKIETLGMKNL